MDADIRSFFDSVDHEWLLRIVSHRIADRRIPRLIRRWLRAGVMEGGVRKETEKGTPQGAGISPLLANIFLHYVFDLWVHQWRQRHARGSVIVVRYADDFVMGFECEDDARRMRADLQERFAKFKLALHPEKTRLLEFGRLPARQRARADQRRPATFAFLGFTHYCGWTRYGAFIVKRKTERTRLTLREPERDIDADAVLDASPRELADLGARLRVRRCTHPRVLAFDLELADELVERGHAVGQAGRFVVEAEGVPQAPGMDLRRAPWWPLETDIEPTSTC